VVDAKADRPQCCLRSDWLGRIQGAAARGRGCEIGYSVSPSRQGCGFATEAIPPSQVTPSNSTRLKWSSRIRSPHLLLRLGFLRNAASRRSLKLLILWRVPFGVGNAWQKLLSASFTGTAAFEPVRLNGGEFRIRSWRGNRIWRAMNANVELVADRLLHLARPGGVVLVDSQFFAPLIELLQERAGHLNLSVRTAHFEDPVGVLKQALVSPKPEIACCPEGSTGEDVNACERLTCCWNN
jgi:hypothetical protein